jgi:hypothetical protein
MFKIGATPPLGAGAVEHADFLELECLRQSDRNASGEDLKAALSRIDDDMPQDRPISDQRLENIVEETFIELAARATHGGQGPHQYPFEVDEQGKLLKFARKHGRWDLYLFMLFATRMNMRDNRVQDTIDGTQVFEEICCEVAKNYLGERAEGLVFGTARRASNDEMVGFQNAVNNMCSGIGEGYCFFNHTQGRITSQDSNLDVVVWKHFNDHRAGKLVGFGQCKTGTHWDAGKFELVPNNFCKKWVRTQPILEPLRLYFITSRPHPSQWHECAVDAGIIFDRCRILDYAPKMANIRPRWQRWLTASIAFNRFRAI